MNATCRAAAFVLASTFALTLSACKDGDPDRRLAQPEPTASPTASPAPTPTASTGRDVTDAAAEAASSRFVLQRATSESASGYATSESFRYRLSRDELAR